MKSFESPFPNRTFDVGGVAISRQDIGTLVRLPRDRARALGVLPLHDARARDARGRRSTRPRAACSGVRVGWMLALGWGLAAVLGAVAGMMAAPTVFLDPNMMLIILIYAFAAAVLGGIDSPVGAVVGGLLLGVIVNVLGAYVDFLPSSRLPTALASCCSS